MAKYKLTAFGMDCVPRISRAQVFDALSSMGNISGMLFDEIFLFLASFISNPPELKYISVIYLLCMGNISGLRFDEILSKILL